MYQPPDISSGGYESEFSNGYIFSAIWRLVETLPVNDVYTAMLAELVDKIPNKLVHKITNVSEQEEELEENDGEICYPAKFEQSKEIISAKWKSSIDRYEEDCWQKSYYSDYFKIRKRIADSLPTKDLNKSEDLAFRASYYSRHHSIPAVPNIITEYYKKDGDNFTYWYLRNPHLLEILKDPDVQRNLSKLAVMPSIEELLKNTKKAKIYNRGGDCRGVYNAIYKQIEKINGGTTIPPIDPLDGEKQLKMINSLKKYLIVLVIITALILFRLY